jgi:hypothetical protein
MVRFDGIDDYMQSPDIPWTPAGVVAAARVELLSSTTSYGMLAATRPAGTPFGWNFRWPLTNGRISIINSSNNTGAGESAASPTGTTTNMVGAGVQGVVGGYGASGWEIWQGGTLRHTGATAFPTSDSFHMQVGARQGSFCANMNLQKLVVLNRAAVAANVASLVDYVAV